MTEKRLSVWQQVDALGIDRNLLYEIGGGFDNIKEIMKILFETLEGYSSIEELEQQPNAIILSNIKRVTQLCCICDNELGKANNALETLRVQMESERIRNED